MKDKKIDLRLTSSEYKKLEDMLKNSSHKSMSSMCREILSNGYVNDKNLDTQEKKKKEVTLKTYGLIKFSLSQGYINNLEFKDKFRNALKDIEAYYR